MGLSDNGYRYMSYEGIMIIVQLLEMAREANNGWIVSCYKCVSCGPDSSAWRPPKAPDNLTTTLQDISICGLQVYHFILGLCSLTYDCTSQNITQNKIARVECYVLRYDNGVRDM